MDLDLFYRIISLVKQMLSLVNFTEATLPNNLYLFEEPRVTILLKILTKFVIVGLFFAPENESLLQIFSGDRMLGHPDELNLLLIADHGPLLLDLRWLIRFIRISYSL